MNDSNQETMKNITIRYAQIDDYPAVEEIMKQVQGMHIAWRPDLYQYSDIMLPLEVFEAAVQSKEFIVAETEGQLAGLLFFVIRHIENAVQVTRDILYIDSMAVAEGFRGQGIGHRLFEYVNEIKKQRNLTGIELQVNAKNLDARAMYEKYGFTEKSITMELL